MYCMYVYIYIYIYIYICGYIICVRQESSTQGLLRQADESTGVVYWRLCLASCVAPHVCAPHVGSSRVSRARRGQTSTIRSARVRAYDDRA